MAQLKSTRIFGTIKSFALTQSTSVDTGALIIAGGVGIGKNITVGGSATIVGNENISGTLAVTGAITGAKFNKVTISAPATGSTLTIAEGKTLVVNNSLTLSGTDGKTMTFPSADDTVMGLGATQTVSGAKTFNNGKLIIAGTTGTTILNASASATGTLVFPAVSTSDTLVGKATTDTLTNKTLTSPILTTPTLGVASASSINKVTITAPATGSTLTIAEGKTLEVNTGNVTIKGNASNSTLTLPTTLTLGASTAGGIIYGGTNAYTSTGAGSAGQALLSGGAGKPTWTSGTLSIASGKSATFTNSLEVKGADKTFDGTGTKLTLAGAFTTTLTTTANTNVTLPIIGTLAVIGGKLSQFAETTSSDLAGVISDETGTGKLVFGTSPTISTSLTTDSTSFDLLNTTATTLNIGGASTEINMGASTGTTTVNNNLEVDGNLIINGTTTTFNTETLAIEDKNIELAKGVIVDGIANSGGGITLKGTTDKTIIWDNTNSNWTSSEHWNIATGKTYKINNTKVLDATTLGSGIVNSSLEKVGTITEGTWQGNKITNTYLDKTSITVGTTEITLGGASTNVSGLTLTSPIINDIKASSSSTSADLWSEITSGSITIGAPNSGNYTTTINSGSGGLNIGTNTNYSRPIIIGSTAGTTAVNIKTASGGLSLDDSYTGTHTVNLATGNTAISKTKTIYIGTGGVTSSTTNITLGSTAGLGSTVINSGTGGVKIGNNSPYNSVDIGNTLGTSSISIETKTGTLNLNSTSTDTHTINIGTGTTATSKTKTIYIGTGGVNGSTTNITLGSTTGVGSTVINSPTAIKIPRLNVVGAMYISNTDGTLASEATLAASRGGTGTGTYVVGDILYASTTTALSRLAKGDSGKVLKMGALIPEWGNDNNNTYSAGTGLSLSGISFSVDYGKTDTTACVGDDARLSDDRTPLSHKHGNITDDGKIGTTSNLVVMTDTGGSVSAKTAGNTNEYLRGDGSWGTPPNDKTNYYPDAFSWTGGTTAGPTGSLSGIGMTAVGFGVIPSASKTASGVVTTGAQTFAGDKILDGTFTADKVYNAVWNDIADFLEVDEDIDIEYGKAYFRDNNGKVRKTNKRNSYSIGIASDTFGFGVGRKDENIKQMPIAIGGWVLAFIDNVYKPGTALIATEDGTLTKASLLTKSFYPERIIAVFDREEKEEFWNKIKVDSRCWVKVK